MWIKVGVPKAPDWFRERSRFTIIYSRHRRKWRIARIKSLCDYYRADELLFELSSNKIIPRVRENGWIHVSSLLFAFICHVKAEYSYLSPLSLCFEFASHRDFIASCRLIPESFPKIQIKKRANANKERRQMKLNFFARLTSGKWDTESFLFLRGHIESHVCVACTCMQAS